MWVSPQSFDQQWLDEFLDILRREQPAWLNGVVFGPQIRVSLPELRAKVPKRYPIRHYPDITHSLQSQYPVPDWDVAYAVTEGREVINPRPIDEAAIFGRLQPYTTGFITYSEGCNDDVNKFVWSSLGWDPGCQRHRYSSPIQPLFHRRRIRRFVRTGPAGTGTKLARPAGDQHRRVHDARTVPEHGGGCFACNATQLALPTSSLPRLLRRLRPPQAGGRIRVGGGRDGSTASG